MSCKLHFWTPTPLKRVEIIYIYIYDYKLVKIYWIEYRMHLYAPVLYGRLMKIRARSAMKFVRSHGVHFCDAQACSGQASGSQRVPEMHLEM